MADMLRTGVENSQGDESIKEETLKILDEAKTIRASLNDDDAQQEYDEVRLSTISALKDLQAKTGDELKQVRNELGGSIDPYTYHKGDISQDEFVAIREEFKDLQRLDVNEDWNILPVNLEGLKDTAFDELSSNQAQEVLDFITNGYLTYPESSSFSSWTNTLSEVSGQSDIRVAQEILIDKVYGEGTFERGYTSDGMILGYARVEGGNFVRSHSDFQEQLQSGDIFNPKMFANYAKYLMDTGRFSELPDIVGDRMKRVQEFISQSGDEDVKTVKRVLIENGVMSPEGGPFNFVREKGVDILTKGMLLINAKTVEGGGEGVDTLVAGLQTLSQTNIFGYGLEEIIGTSLYQEVQEKFNSLQDSNENIHTRLFKLSSTIHDVGEGLYHTFPVLKGNLIEQAHNKTTEGLILKMIQEEGENLAVGFNSQDGYYVHGESEFKGKLEEAGGDIKNMNKTEVGTFLCSIHQKTNSPEEMLAKIETIFGVENTLLLLSEFKDGDFGGENFSGANWMEFYKPLLNGYETKMVQVAKLFFESPRPTDEKIAVLNQSHSLPETGRVISECNLCKDIDQYTSEDIQRISPESWEILQTNQPEFHEGLQRKLEIISENQRQNIENELTNIAKGIVGETFSDELKQQITGTTEATIVFMGEYFKREPQDICVVELSLLINQSPDSPLVRFKEYLETTYETEGTNIVMSGNNIASIGLQARISEQEINIDTVRARIAATNIPEDERKILETTLTELEEDNTTLSQKNERLNTLKNLNPETYALLQSLSNNGISNEELGKILELYSKKETSEIYRNPKRYISQITHKQEVINLLQYEGDDNFQRELNKIQVIDIHPSLRGELLILRNLPIGISSSDINDIPERVFLQGGIQGKNRLIGIVKLGIEDNSFEVATHLTGNILRRAMHSNGNTNYGVMIVQEILDGHSFTEEQKGTLLAGIPESYFRVLKSRGINVGLNNNENITEDIFKQRVGELEDLSTGLYDEEVDWIVRDIDSYIAQNSVVSMHGDIIEMLIEKNYIRLAPNIISAVAYGKDDNHHGEGFYVQYQKQLIDQRASYITYFPSEGVADSSIIDTLVSSSRGIDHLRGLIKYINLSGFNQLKTLYEATNKKYGNEGSDIAGTIIGSDKRFLEIGERVINSSIDDEKKQFVYNIFSHMTQMSEEFQAGKENMEGLEKEAIEQKIIGILQEIGAEGILENNADIDKLITIYSSNTPPVESIGILINIFENKEIASNFMRLIATERQNEIRGEVDELATRINLLENNSPEFSNLFENNTFITTQFTSGLNEFYTNGEYPETQEGVQEAINNYIEKFNLTDEQRNIVHQIIEKEKEALGWNTFGNNVPALIAAYEAGGDQGVQEVLDGINNARLNAGLPFLTPDEVDNSTIFDPETKTLEPNPNYIPSEESSNNNESVPSQTNQSPSNSTDTSLSHDFGGTPEAPIILTPSGSIELSQDDYKLLQNNPEAQKNYIETYEAFKETGLSKLWDIRESIFTSISNVKGISFSIKKDYINKNELKILFDSLLISIDEETLQAGTMTTQGIITEMEARNGRNGNGEESQVNSYGETRIEAEFLNRYFPKGSTMFKHQEFENALGN